MNRERVDVGPFALDDIEISHALCTIRHLSKSDEYHYVVTPNVDHFMRVLREGRGGKLEQIYRSASLCICDSRILQKLIWIAGGRSISAIPGSSLTERLFNEALSESDSIQVIGGDADMMEALTSQYPTLHINHYDPPMGFIHDADATEEVLDRICNQAADYTFLAIGSPQQEIVAHLIGERGGRGGVALCVGASLLLLTGRLRRAPRWVQQLHCEWFYRWTQDPVRLGKRYILNALYLVPIALRISRARWMPTE